MIFLRHPAAALFATAFAAAVLPVSAQPINPVVREGVTEKISDHVHVIPDGSVPLVPNVGIVVGTRGIFIVDTGLGMPNGQAVVREAAKHTQTTEIHIGSTHFHPEHDLGANAFPPTAKMLRSTDQQKDIDEFGLQMARAFSARSPYTAEALKDAAFRKADTLFEREHVVDLGGVRVRAIAMGANHTRGDTVFLVEPDGILFSGDVVMKPLPSFASPYSSTKHWLASLDALAKLQPKKLVPSHGPIGDATYIADYRTYFTTIQTRTAELKKQGKTIDEAAQTIATELQSKYPDRGRVTGAVRNAYAEAP